MASLSARRAWIEIDIPANLDADHAVALRKESVDRNMSGDVSYSIIVNVALRKESVDRNTNMMESSCAANCRSPQGERG